MFHTKFEEKIKTHVLHSLTFFSENRALYEIMWKTYGRVVEAIHDNTGCLQMNSAVSKVNKKFISRLTRAKRIPLAAATVQVSHALPGVRSLVLTAGLQGQFTRWRRSRKRLSVCSVLRCPDL